MGSRAGEVRVSVPIKQRPLGEENGRHRRRGWRSVAAATREGRDGARRAGGSAVKLWTRAGLLILGVTLSGCVGIAKGVTEALLDDSNKQDTRACHIMGPPYQGLEALLERQEAKRAADDDPGTLKILMVHGIGRHLPGYSGRLQEHLMRALDLDVVDETVKHIRLADPDVTSGPLGELRILRFTNKARSRELLFYELTWSEITEQEKQVISFDDSGEWTFRRAKLNAWGKSFLNSHLSDPLIYLGNARLPIIASVRQSLCWMSSADWEGYAEEAHATCDFLDQGRIKLLEDDDYAIISHSLGSRIVMDMLAYVTIATAGQEAFKPYLDIYREKSIPIFMLANQLPLLELGREPAGITGEISAYCKADGVKFAERTMGELPIFAFSDPNDLLSYGIPPEFVQNYLDSRLCPRVTNIILNVTQPISLLGLGDFANPAEAHGAYDHDARVIAIMAHGFGHDQADALVDERCTWMETTRDW